MPDFFKSGTEFTDTGNLHGSQIAATEPGMAHFAQTSGTEYQCKHCESWRRLKTNSGKPRCLEFIRLTGDDSKIISGDAYACKYFKYGPEKKK